MEEIVEAFIKKLILKTMSSLLSKLPTKIKENGI